MMGKKLAVIGGNVLVISRQITVSRNHPSIMISSPNVAVKYSTNMTFDTENTLCKDTWLISPIHGCCSSNYYYTMELLH